MNSRTLLNLGLLALVIVLVLVVVYQPGKPDPEPLPTLTTLDSKQIQQIEIMRYGAASKQKHIVLQKKNGNWQMQQPWQLPANSFRIDNLLELLAAVSFSNNDLTQLDKATFGLDKPLASIRFDNTEIVFGHNRSLNHNRYVRIGKRLHMIADKYYYQLVAKAESYIDHRLLPDNVRIRALQLPAGFRMHRQDGNWQVNDKQRYSADSLNRLVDEWQLTQAYDIERATVAATDKADIVIELDNNTTRRFKLESDNKQFALRDIDRGLRYLLAADRKQVLLSPQDEQEK